MIPRSRRPFPRQLMLLATLVLLASSVACDGKPLSFGGVVALLTAITSTSAQTKDGAVHPASRETGTTAAAAVKWPTASYYDNLREWPVVTKSLTAGMIGGLGDLLAQWMEVSCFRSLPHYAARRALSVSLEGMLVSGPLMHFSYQVLEDWIPVDNNHSDDDSNNHGNHDSNSNGDSSNFKKWMNSFLQVFLDSLVMNCVYVASLMLITGILEGQTRQHIRMDFQLEYRNAVKAAWLASMAFAPVQTIMFRYVPIMFRVLGMNLQDIVWNASVSYVAHRQRRNSIDDGCTNKTNATLNKKEM